VEIVCYYFPNYHVDPRNEAAHGPGWTEWELLRRAEPRFPGHRQPRVPLWGYEDESDPAVMARKIAAAADHGIAAFLFDWYWYDDGPFLGRALDEGFLRAPNVDRLKFALMWANHDWVDIHPAKLGGGGLGPDARVLYPGTVTRATWDAISERLVTRYFPHPAYWRVDGRPYFSIYDLERFRIGLGGIGPARAALDALRERATAAGLPGVHLNAVIWSTHLLPGESAVGDPAGLVRVLGFDSLTSYVWVHHAALAEFPETDYDAALARYLRYWDAAATRFDTPYFPNVTVGWDPSPRTVQSDAYLNAGYPFTPVLAGATPERFEAALRAVAARGPAILTINAWNEWTEGSYLEPDAEHGMAYLEAVQRVLQTGIY
jgi:hypothetical protein